MNSVLSIYVIVLTVIAIVGCVWLLRWTGKRRPGDPKPEDTSHTWDEDLTEYNKPMPRWWLVMFYLTIVFGIGYLVYYPGLGGWRGTSGWSSAKEHQAAQERAEKRLAETFAAYEGRSIEELAQNEEALRHGRSIFANHCATCHGSDGRGAKGFPDLTDDVWHWGGSAEDILATITGGRQAAMPPMEAILGPNGLTETAVYVMSLSGRPGDPGLIARGRERFAGICSACHGPDGKGDAAIGAPDLTDNYWQYGGDYQSIRTSVAHGRQGMMPAHEPLIGRTRARLVAAFVYAQANPQDATQAASTGSQ
jgi:cytochrome c oxidase cbb3-type subunit 3